ncbi:hypothetical protein M6B38_243360 [Iris pallida]|uniref:Uncharacterized protein n=1 Tax=Iris pallida TaxID=29817 RepID=A0AAX6DIT6_IRIPA|nr:hypothetical protein M6B38_243360 [Iris pallida]
MRPIDNMEVGGTEISHWPVGSDLWAGVDADSKATLAVQ